MPIKVILKEDIDNLGKAGDLATVKPGYARNYLIPRGMAVIATLQNLTWLKEHRQKLQEEANNKKSQAAAIKDTIEKFGEIEIQAAVGPTGKLFGRVGIQDLANKISEISNAEINLNRKAISIPGYLHGIDELGSYKAVVDLGSGVRGAINLIISEETAY